MLWRQPKRTAHPLQWVFISSNYALSHSCSARLIFFPSHPSHQLLENHRTIARSWQFFFPKFSYTIVNRKKSVAFFFFFLSLPELSRNRKHQTISNLHLSGIHVIFSKSISCQLTPCKYASYVESEDKLPQEPIRQAARSPWQQQSLGAVVKATGLSACLGQGVKCKCDSQTWYVRTHRLLSDHFAQSELVKAPTICAQHVL